MSRNCCWQVFYHRRSSFWIILAWLFGAWFVLDIDENAKNNDEMLLSAMVAFYAMEVLIILVQVTKILIWDVFFSNSFCIEPFHF